MTAPFQATIVRYVHDVLTGESLNIGVVLLSPSERVLETRFLKLWSRVTTAFPRADPVHLRRTAALFLDACLERQARLRTELTFGGSKDVVALVREFLPEDDASLKLSPVISGITSDHRRTLDELFERYVDRYVELPQRQGREDETIWRDFADRLSDRDILQRLTPRVVPGRYHQDVRFQHTYRNGVLNAVQPVSLDLVEADKIRGKASALYGRFDLIDRSEEPLRIHLLVGLPDENRPEEVRRAAADGADMLREQLSGYATVYTERESPALEERIREGLAHHDQG